MDELDLSEIENRWDKAFPLIQMGCFSKGCSVGYGFVVNDEFESKYAPASQEFIDNAPMDISALVLEVKRLRQDRAEVWRDALLKAAKVERERIVKIVQGLLYEAESNAIEKPEYYDDIYLYKGIIDLIAEGQSQGQGKE